MTTWIEQTHGRPSTTAPTAGSVVVVVDDPAQGWDAVEWAAAEAAARDRELRIVHALKWPPHAWDTFSGIAFAAQYPRAADQALQAVAEATARARRIAPGLVITTFTHAGPPVAVALTEGRGASLLVVGRKVGGGRLRTGESVSRQIAAQARGSVAVIGSLDGRTFGPHSGRVVAIIGGEDPGPALSFAFRSARRRRIGLTVMHFPPPTNRAPGQQKGERVEFRACIETLRRRSTAFSDVDVSLRLLTSLNSKTIPASAEGAALLVMSGRTRGRLRRSRFGPLERAVWRTVPTPVVFVGEG